MVGQLVACKSYSYINSREKKIPFKKKTTSSSSQKINLITLLITDLKKMNSGNQFLKKIY